jgi:hypothetical protein
LKRREERLADPAEIFDGIGGTGDFASNAIDRLGRVRFGDDVSGQGGAVFAAAHTNKPPIIRRARS